MAGSAFHLLKERGFLSLFVTQFLGAFNDNLFRSALIMLITFRLANDVDVAPAILNNLAIGLFILPYFLFSAFAGELADKFEKARQVLFIKLWEVGLALFGGVAFHMANLPFLMAVLAGLGLQSTFFGPIKYGILPDLVKREDLLAANALIEAGTFISILLGTLVGGLLILTDEGIESVTTLVLVVAVLGTISGALVPKMGAAAPHIRITPNIFASTRRELKAAWASDIVRPAIIGISWIWALGSIYLTQLPVLVHDRLGGDETVVTLFLAVFSLGIGVGSFLSNQLLRGNVSAKLALPGLGLLAAFSLLLPLVVPAMPPLGAAPLDFTGFLGLPEGWMVLALVTLTSLAGGLVIVPLYTLLQERTPREGRSRVIAVNNIVNSGFMAGSAGIAALLAASGLDSLGILIATAAGSLLAILPLKPLDKRLQA
ncbi:MFS transporter [Gimibacter soli]|uniref:MFS transporter n=1 Tax=Gimibacter soli TaxID=3024400 RepID=A0AAE9XPN8_9PROT|nr:MFS transporter [Gimibacter soli]WCL54923.1 MFS transporter [Gimibacter soli]